MKRTLTPLALALGCAVGGGTVGSLATAAEQSAASPAQIAAAVAVRDQQAERSLTAINAQLKAINFELGSSAAGGASVKDLLFEICSNSEPGAYVAAPGGSFVCRFP